jgi:hypothetical protein
VPSPAFLGRRKVNNDQWEMLFDLMDEVVNIKAATPDEKRRIIKDKKREFFSDSVSEMFCNLFIDD